MRPQTRQVRVAMRLPISEPHLAGTAVLARLWPYRRHHAQRAHQGLFMLPQLWWALAPVPAPVLVAVVAPVADKPQRDPTTVSTGPPWPLGKRLAPGGHPTSATTPSAPTTGECEPASEGRDRARPPRVRGGRWRPADG